MLIIAKIKKLSPYIIMLFIIGSFTVNINLFQQSLSNEIFYYPHSRFWQILIGALITYIPQNCFQSGRKYLDLIGVIIIVYTIFEFEQNSIYPGYVGLLPTIGASFIIAATKDSPLNKLILSRRSFVSIGLISYPLYLLHWPVLSFAKIMNTTQPSPYITIGLLILCFPLSFLLYRYIEKPLRFQSKNVVPLMLFTALMIIGLSGYLILEKKGIKNRSSLESYYYRYGTDVFSTPPSTNTLCKEEITDQTGYCLFIKSQNQESIAIIGDSKANMVTHGLLDQKLSSKYNILNLGQASCPPFRGLDHFGNKCKNAIKHTIDYVINQKSIKYVVIAGAFNSYIRGLFKDKIDQSLFLPLFKSGLSSLISELLKSNKKIIFIHDFPNISFNPKQCITRPLQLLWKKVLLKCNVTDLTKKPNLASTSNSIINNILSHYPNVIVIDPYFYLCKDSTCMTSLNNQPLYRDEPHLNQHGIRYFIQKSNFMNLFAR